MLTGPQLIEKIKAKKKLHKTPTSRLGEALGVSPKLTPQRKSQKLSSLYGHLKQNRLPLDDLTIIAGYYGETIDEFLQLGSLSTGSREHFEKLLRSFVDEFVLTRLS